MSSFSILFRMESSSFVQLHMMTLIVIYIQMFIRLFHDLCSLLFFRLVSLLCQLYGACLLSFIFIYLYDNAILFNIVIHIFGKEHEALLVAKDQYNLIYIFSDAKILSTSVGLRVVEELLVKVRIPKNEREVVYLDTNKYLLNTFTMFKNIGVGAIFLDLEILPLDMDTLYEILLPLPTIREEGFSLT